MDIKKAKNILNRRHALRIFEQADIFYHKINIAPEIEAKLDFDTILDNTIVQSQTNKDLSPTNSNFNPLLPESYSQENDTLNVNISTSGISFTCEEKLNTGDYLMLRVLLLSSMTVITSCCKVVYTKPSNPFETDQYPYLIGAHFINLKPIDKALLDKHINKRKIQSYITNSLLTLLVILCLIMPEVIFEELLHLGSYLIEAAIELITIGYDLLDHNLNKIVQFLFHTDWQNTHKISFYTIIAIGTGLLFPLIRLIISTGKKLFYRFHRFYCRKKSSIRYYWQEQTLLYKTGAITLITCVITLYVLFFI